MNEIPAITKTVLGNSSVQLLPGGELSIKNAEKLKKALLEAFEEYSELTVQLSQTVRIDITALQLLFSLKKLSLKSGKRLELDFEDEDYLAGVLEHSGFDKLLAG